MGKVLERLAWNKCAERNEDTKDLKQRNQLGAYFNHLRKYTENLNWDNDNGKERKIYSTSQMEQCYRYKINRTQRLSTYYEGEWDINSLQVWIPNAWEYNSNNMWKSSRLCSWSDSMFIYLFFKKAAGIIMDSLS